MRGIISFLLLANIFCLTVGVKYTFIFYVELICKVHDQENFGFNIQFYDKDVAPGNPDDEITGPYVDSTRAEVVKFGLRGNLTGDEFLSKFFDVKMVLYHTCNTINEETRFVAHLSPLFPIPEPVYSRTYTYTIKQDISNLSGEMRYNGKLVYT